MKNQLLFLENLSIWNAKGFAHQRGFYSDKFAVYKSERELEIIRIILKSSVKEVIIEPSLDSTDRGSEFSFSINKEDFILNSNYRIENREKGIYKSLIFDDFKNFIAFYNSCSWKEIDLLRSVLYIKNLNQSISNEGKITFVFNGGETINLNIFT